MKFTGFYIFTIIIQATCTTTRVSESLLQKPLLHPSDINPLISPRLYETLVESDYFITELPPSTTTAMQRCTQYVTQFCQGDSVQRLQVGFTDSNKTWLLCKCTPRKLAQVVLPGKADNWSYLLGHLSRIPVPLREYIHVVVSTPLETEHTTSSSLAPTKPSLRSTLPHGMMSQNTVVLFGEPSIATWIHEAAHGYSGERLSSSVRWVEAIHRDSCLPDPYSRTNLEEAFAQTVMLKVYLQMQPVSSEGTRDDLLGDVSCMRHQLDILEGLSIFAHDRRSLSRSGSTLEIVQKEATWWELWVITSFLVILFMLS
ncbi:SubName: Full=Uncharacterized protein {ECO:0000313/EMBL:CCA68132.1} [Serendipita indica DSM 11827]|uniref:Uncharacterized protein n=1 Tax=Serendipita indica (strain DSM 11827) TaxID=1109443 RepID=G4T9X6_SERID|nr:SubName: Full=Uncharacterized protein {ECO:0000313/EMBL:CCA68132.1} [Serendipita indica DSM 11827]CCA68132.1 hypothetical protein PIIN_01999 [Serendipita indica DSM 11827]